MNYYGELTNDVNARETKNTTLARRAARESFVLLKNENNTLPLSTKKIALFGMGARYTVAGGEGSGETFPRYKVNIEQGLINAGYEITSGSWLDDYEKDYADTYQEFHDMVEEKIKDIQNPVAQIPEAHKYKYRYPSGRLITEEDIAKSNTDTAIYVLIRQAGEGTDRKVEKGDFLMTDIEVANIRLLAERYEHVTLIINIGGLVDLTPVADLEGLGAIVYMVQGGMEGGNALADVLSGAYNFSGHLTDSWPMNYEQIPDGSEFAGLNGNEENEYYTEGRYVGYRYFSSFGVKPRYPFGYGLSYTSFDQKIKSVTVEKTAVEVIADIANTGKAAGRDVVQLYIAVPSSVNRSLCAFAKTDTIMPCEVKEVRLSFKLEDQAVYDEAKSAWKLPAGEYRLLAGSNAEEVSVIAGWTLEKEILVEQDRTSGVSESAETKVQEIEAPVQTTMELPEDAYTLHFDPSAFACHTVDYTEPEAEESEAVKKTLDHLSLEEQVELLRGGDIMNQAQNDQHLITAAVGKTAITLLEKGVPNIAFSDGPAVINIMNEVVYGEDGSVKAGFVPERYMWGKMKLMASRMIGTTGQHVYRYTTAWPVELLLAQSWDTALLEEVGSALGDELLTFGITLILAPALNIHRNPLCGRNFEYYSEDPLISGKMAAAYTRGVQKHEGVGVTLKHFCCNNQETNRAEYSANVTERTLREIYLKGFEIAVKESHPKAVMSSYNRLNGTYTGERHDLITDILRSEWGFAGLVMTDWNTNYDAAKALHAQVDMMMPGKDSDKEGVLAGLQNGTISEHDVRRSAARVLALIEQSAVADLK